MQPTETAPLPADPTPNRRLMARLTLIALGTVALVVACDKVPLTSPTGSTIVLSIDKSILPVNGVATVIAVVTESSGTAVHNGTTVTFQTSLGRTEPVEAQTLNGKATVLFHAGSLSGTAAIHAFSGSARTGSGNSSAGGVSVLVGSAAAGSVSVNALPSTVPQNGGTVTVSARVLDTANNPLPSVGVGFAADQGSLGSTSAVTNDEGVAQTTLTTSRVTKVIASIAGKTSEFTINVVTAPTVTISAPSPASPIAGQPVSFTLTPSSATTANPLQTLIVDFGDGSPTQTFNGITGQVGVTHVYNREGGYTLTATAIDINGVRGVSSQAVVVTFALPPTITSFSANPNPVPVTANGLTTFTIAVAAGSAPIRSVQVKLSNGTVIFSGTSGGSFTYQFGTFPGGGTSTVTATVTDALGNVGTATMVVVVQG